MVAESLFIIGQGKVSISVKGNNGEEIPVGELGAGDSLGELALLVPDAERVARVRATTHARLLSVPRATFDQLLRSEPSFALTLLRELASRLVAVRTGA